MQSEVYLEKNHGLIIFIIFCMLIVLLLTAEMFEASNRDRRTEARVLELEKKVNAYESQYKELSKRLKE